MTTPTVSLEDLALLDDPFLHGACGRCHQPGFTGAFVARCGRKSYAFAPKLHRIPPANACPDCVRIWRARIPCTVCGGTP